MGFTKKVTEKYEVVGFPRLITGSDFKLKKILGSKESNQKLYQELMKKSNLKVLQDFKPNGQLLQSGQKIFIANNDDKLIDYFVQYEIKRAFGVKVATQIAVWVSTTSPYYKYMDSGEHIGTYVFFNILFPLTGAVLTDALQTEDGKRFWIYRMTEAIEKGFHVYAILRDNAEKYKVASSSDIRKLEQMIWGTEAAHENRKILISAKDEFPRAKAFFTGPIASLSDH